MKRRPEIPLAAAAMATALTLVACGGSSTGGGRSAGGFDGALHAVVNPSDRTGGTIVFDSSSSPDSTDPGNTYYADMWNIVRLYGRSLVTYRSEPGAAGLQLVPDLATSLGKVSDHGSTWTYHLRSGIRFEDGTIVTSQDVKYAVERSFARGVLPLGPSYFSILLKDPSYPGPYKDQTPGKLGLTSVTTPDPATIVFHLQRPFSEFDYVVALPQTVPVPPTKDRGANYQLHPMSTGPYKFQSYQLDKQFTLVRNPYWNPATDPNRKRLASRIVVNLNVNPDMVDANLIHNFAQVNLDGTGVQAAARAQVLTSPALKSNADDVPTDLLWFTYINTKVKPLDDVHCRRAVEYAADKTAFQTAYGGPVAGGDVAVGSLESGLVGRILDGPAAVHVVQRFHLRIDVGEPQQIGRHVVGVALQSGAAEDLRPSRGLHASPVQIHLGEVVNEVGVNHVGVNVQVDHDSAGEPLTVGVGSRISVGFLTSVNCLSS